MIFDLEEKDDGVWFDLPEGGRIKLRTISPKDYFEIKKVTTKRGEPIVTKVDGIARLFEREILDRDKEVEMIRDKTIVDWEGVFDKNNKPIPVTLEWKTALMLMKDNSFRDFVTEKLKELMEAETNKKEETEKN